MNKGLEALKKIYIEENPTFEDYQTIEKELKRLEEIDNVMFLNNKKLKALEIIRKYIYVSKPFENACYICLNDEREMIPEEEYDLLKEVLGL